MYREKEKRMPNSNVNEIIVGLDGSPCSEDALHWAVDEAKRSSRGLVLVNVWHWRNDAMASPLSLVGGSDSHKTGRALLGRAALQAREVDVPVITHLLEGIAPANVLVDAADGAAMLVVGSRGHRALAQMLLGSVSSGCVQRASCPVVVVPPASRQTDPVRPLGAATS
jgi:nucleotide-binding universal stress UspA family protein